MKKLFEQYETTDLNLNVFFKYINTYPLKML